MLDFMVKLINFTSKFLSFFEGKENRQMNAFIAFSFKPLLAPLKDLLCNVLKDNGFNPIFLEKKSNGEKETVLNIVVRNIKDSRLIIVDISEINPNIFFELGLAFGLDKSIILIKDINKKSLPSDIQGYLYLEYDLENLSKFKNILNEILRDYKSSLTLRKRFEIKDNVVSEVLYRPLELVE